ncbi:MAG: enoyl-CoA hydratase/isomerase family protein [Pseudonocardiales bacterium]|nr:enoyl-CoA hydratase/isomerase family protein [Pseudonocardiales bacterium]
MALDSEVVREFVRFEVDGGIGTIRLDRPPVNALSRQVQEEIRSAAQQATDRTEVRAVIVYGGEKMFSVGADVKEMATMPAAELAAQAGAISSSVSAVADIPKPTVAAITGFALGGGYELALCCDRRIAGADAKVGLPEILLGIIPGAGGTQRLPRLIGPSRAKELIYTGRIVEAEEALRIGLVDEVVAAEDGYAAAWRWASQFVAGPARALAAAKAAIDDGLDVYLSEGLRLETEAFGALAHTDDRVRGMRSFLDHGPGKATFVGS